MLGTSGGGEKEGQFDNSKKLICIKIDNFFFNNINGIPTPSKFS